MSTIISSLIIIASIIGLFHLPSLSIAIEIQTDESKRIILIREDFNGGAFSLQIGGVLFSPPSNNNKQWRVHLSNICRDQHDHSQDKEVEVACQYDAILQRVQSTAIVEMNRLKSSSFHNNHDDDGVNEEERDYTDEIEYNTATIEQLSPLASFHKWQLDNADALGLTFAMTDEDDDDYFNTNGKMHYHRSLGTLLSSEYYHTATWTLLQREEELRKKAYAHLYDEYSSIPSVYERHAISQGMLGVALQLSDLYGLHLPTVAVDTTGNTDAIEICYEVSSAKARVILVGVPTKGKKASFYTLPMHFGKTVKGSEGGGSIPQNDIPLLVELISEGLLTLNDYPTHKFAFNQINDAVMQLRNGLIGRIIINFENE